MAALRHLSTVCTSTRVCRWPAATAARLFSASGDASSKAADVIAARNAALREEHFRLPEEVPPHAFDGSGDIRREDMFRKRLIYRAKQRGWLEVDLILGTWANQHVPGLSMEECVAFEQVLKAETVDVYNYITGQAPVPEELAGGVMDSILAFAKAAPVGHASPEGYSKVKAGMSN